MMTANEIFFCFRMDFIQPDTVVVDFGKFEERGERRSWRMVRGRTTIKKKSSGPGLRVTKIGGKQIR